MKLTTNRSSPRTHCEHNLNTSLNTSKTSDFCWSYYAVDNFRGNIDGVTFRVRVRHGLTLGIRDPWALFSSHLQCWVAKKMDGDVFV